MDIADILRLKIADALVAPTGYRIDYIQPGDDMKPAFMLLQQNKALMITPGDQRQHAAAILHFLRRIDVSNCLRLPSPGDNWHLESGGSEDNILWEHPIKSLTIPDPEFFFRASPYTHMLRTTATLAYASNHDPIYQGRTLIGVDITRQRGALGVTTERDFLIGRIYELRPERGKLPIPGYVRLQNISKTILGCLSREYLLGEGVSNWFQFRSSWERANNGKYDINKAVWVLSFERVYQIAPETIAHIPVVKPPPTIQPVGFIPQQLPLFVAV